MANNNGTISFYLYSTTKQGQVPSFFDIKINVTTNTGLNLGIVDAWCIDTGVGIEWLKNYTGTLYATNEYQTWDSAIFPTVGNKENFDSVTWLLNQDFSKAGNVGGYTYADVQGAIWTLLGDGNTSTWAPGENYNMTRISQLVTLALSHDGYKADITDADTTNDYTTLAIDTLTADGTTAKQPLIIKVQSAALGDYVWEDTNADGIQDATEKGIAGVEVKLVRDLNNDNKFDGPNEVLQTTTTGPNGEYKFVGLTPGADYRVVFSTPNGFDNASPRHIGDIAKDSDGAVSDIVVLGAGEWNKTIDAGFYKLASLGDRVWVDANANGVQDAGEANKEGVTVELYKSSDLTTPITSQVTGSDGAYKFTDLV
ncbi:SdrD B-like domain-containing protein, partial [Methylocucumis oryzae]